MIRLKKGLSQTEVAQRLGADKSYISCVENGLKNPTLATLEKLSEALSVSIDELLK